MKKYSNIVKKTKREIIRDIKECIDMIQNTPNEYKKKDDYITSLNLFIKYKDGNEKYYYCEEIEDIENLNERDIEDIIFSNWEEFFITKSLKNYIIEKANKIDIDNVCVFDNTVLRMEFK